MSARRVPGAYAPGGAEEFNRAALTPNRQERQDRPPAGPDTPTKPQVAAPKQQPHKPHKRLPWASLALLVLAAGCALVYQRPAPSELGESPAGGPQAESQLLLQHTAAKGSSSAHLQAGPLEHGAAALQQQQNAVSQATLQQQLQEATLQARQLQAQLQQEQHRSASLAQQVELQAQHQAGASRDLDICTGRAQQLSYEHRELLAQQAACAPARADEDAQAALQGCADRLGILQQEHAALHLIAWCALPAALTCGTVLYQVLYRRRHHADLSELYRHRVEEQKRQANEREPARPASVWR